MNCLICCFQTLSALGFRNYLLKNIAFHPPKDLKYDLVLEPNLKNGISCHKMILKDPKGHNYMPRDVDGLQSNYFWLQPKTKRPIPAVFYRNNNNKSNQVILYSHGNSTDLGRIRLALEDLAVTLNVHVFAYEYFGYGPCSGTPSDIEIIHDITAAYKFLTQKLYFKSSEIILYGRSIGSGPSLYIASHPEYPVSGVILHSPIASGMRILNINIKKTKKDDLFPNIDFIEHVKAHVFILHGDADREVSIKHGKLLDMKVKNKFESWWVENGGHNDIDHKFRRHYFTRLNRFIKHIREFNKSKNSQELSEFYAVEDWHKKFNHVYFNSQSKYLVASDNSSKPYDILQTTSNSSFISGSSTMMVKTQAESMVTCTDQTLQKIALDSNRENLSSKRKSNFEVKRKQSKDSDSDNDTNISCRSTNILNDKSPTSTGRKIPPKELIDIQEKIQSDLSFGADTSMIAEDNKRETLQTESVKLEV